MSSPSARVRILLAFSFFTLGCTAGPDKENPTAIADAEIEVLRKLGLKTDKAALSSYLRTHSPASIEPTNLKPLLDRFSSDDFDERKQAARQLIQVGVVALPALHVAAQSTDAEVRRRAASCIHDIKKAHDWWVPELIVAQLLRHPDKDVCLTLLQFVPFAIPETRETIWYALAQLVRKEPNLLKLLEPSFKDKSAERRALCGFLLARHGDDRQKMLAQAGLRDVSAEVRLRTAQGFLAAGDKQPIPVLIGLLEEPSFARAWQAEELLRWFAKGKKPNQLVKLQAPAARTACSEAWQKWWDEHKDKRWEPDKAPPGLVATAESDGSAKKYALRLYGSDGTCRWSWSTSSPVHDCQFLPNDRMLITQPEESLVSERDLNGKIIWKKSIRATQLRRFPNGATWLRALDMHLIDGDQESKIPFPRLIVPFHMDIVHPRRAVLAAFDADPATRAIIEWDPTAAEFTRQLKIEIRKGGRDDLYSVHALSDRTYLLKLWKRLQVRDSANRVIHELQMDDWLDDAVILRDGTLLLSAMSDKVNGQYFLTETGWDGRRSRVIHVENQPVRCIPYQQLVRLGFSRP